MKRREFLRGAAAGVVGSLGMTLAACGGDPAATPPSPPAAGEVPEAAAPAQGSSLPAIEWRMATSWPTSLDTIYGGATVLAERVGELTDGMFKITTYPAGELFGGLEVLQNVQQGTVEAGHSAMYYYTGLSPAWGIATSLPFGLTATQMNAWLYHGGGNEAIDKLGAQFNAILFPAGNTGTQMGGWFRREINTVADLQGLKVRIPGLGGQVMARLGAVVQVVPGGEIFQALSTGAVDAAEWVGPYDDQKLGLQDAAEFYYSPGWWEPGPTLHAFAGLDAWATIPDEYKRVFKVAAWESNMNMISKYEALNGTALNEILASGKIKLRVYSDEIMTAAQEAAFALYDETAAADANFKEMYDPWKVFRANVFGWNSGNEATFTNFVYNNRNWE
ncbi:MAG: ABC transporter substrate-binding protein [Candidatus Viridilinea halotolerans]|uniref:ABC transporter substrate-binding protein n=1 Tax=Candidatus Viridilinea halotolerans TaxID=2491704 RepID=A0A426U820_9CHLR|nr:MAG: ABC transporter substrate-binding protein [Candidatus Viridilinea halotolerans]